MRRRTFLAAAGAAPVVLTLGAARAPERLVVDLDGDGRPDVITLDQTPSAITVHVRFADPAHKPQVFRFGVDGGREDAVCRVPVHLEIVPHRGVAVVDGACDSIHLTWNRRTKRLEWWRL